MRERGSGAIKIKKMQIAVVYMIYSALWINICNDVKIHNMYLVVQAWCQYDVNNITVRP